MFLEITGYYVAQVFEAVERDAPRGWQLGGDISKIYRPGKF